MFTKGQVDKQSKIVENQIKKAFRDIFPIEGDKHILDVLDLEFTKPKNLDSFEKHKEIKLKNRSLTYPVKAHFVLKNRETGKEIDRKKVSIIRMPAMTPRGSFIIDGNEYQTTHQMRLKPGVYTRIANNGELESHVNIQNKAPFKIKLDPKSELFTIQIGTKKIDLYSFLSGVGATDAYIKKFIGENLLEKNKSGADPRKAVTAFASKISYSDITDLDEAKKTIKEFFSETEMDKETTKVTLGKGFGNVNTEMFLETAKKLLAVTKGDQEEDDRDSLSFKKIMGVEDYLEDTLKKSVDKIERSIKYNVDRHTDIKRMVSPKDFNNPIKSFFTTSDLSTAVEVTNPLNAIGNYNKITIMGEGGVTSDRQISDDMININPSTLGFLDPVHTPESSKIGANLHLSALAEKEGNDIVTRVIETKTGKIKKIKPSDLEQTTVAFPGQYDRKKNKFKEKKVKVLDKKEVKEVSPNKVDYALLSSKGMFDVTTNMIPLLQNIQGNRAMMGGKMQEQALSLREREAPLVQSGISKNKSFEKSLGENNCIKSPVNGTVHSVKPLVIKDNKNKKHEISLYDHYPLGGSSMNNHEVNVKKGDKVKKGEIIADSNFTKGGEMALGTNLKVAFMPYKGYTFEDGLVVSEIAAKDRLASNHLYVEEIDADKDHTIDAKKYKTYFPNELSPDNELKLGNDGIIKKGQKVEQGDILVAAFKKKNASSADLLLNNIKNNLAMDKQDVAIRWDKDVEGEIKDIVKNGNLVKITIRTEESAKVGDKVVGRYGNKGTITKIIPDNEMPKTEDGDPIEVILNPHTIPSRMNPSQLIETAAAKIAEKTGKPYIVDNFDGENHLEHIKKEMKRLGIKEKEIIVDPNEGELEKPIFVGKQYMLKLHHQTKKKFSSRGFNEGYDMDGQPLRGGNNSGQAMDVLTNYTLLAHGAKENLKEMATIKSTKNDEFWRAFQNGDPLPKPETSPVFDKFIAHLEATGIKVNETHDSYQLMAMTDKDIDKMSAGKIDDAKVIKATDLQEEKGGIFDPEVTGGKEGDKWSHIELEEPVPNPLFEKAIRSVLDLKGKDYKAILGGQQELSGKTGTEAIENALSKIDIEKELKETKDSLDNIPKSRLDKAHKKIRYLEGLEKTGKTPTDYIMRKIPVLPPKFRPIYELPDGNVGVSDVNEFYRHVLLVNDAIKRDKETGILDEKGIGDERTTLYDAVSALQGISDPITDDAKRRGRKGILRYLGGTNGTQPKNAFFQSKVIKRRQDLSGRSTIVAGPELGVDEIGMPEEMAWDVYKPHLMKKLIAMGVPPSEARNEHYEKRSKMAKRALEQVAEETPVILNRAPSLHKFSTLAFKPQLVEGKSIRLPSLVTNGFNADFDFAKAKVA